ncbi:uncharacterized protein PAE49_003425 [Odontesthes bonariensis]
MTSVRTGASSAGCEPRISPEAEIRRLRHRFDPRRFPSEPRTGTGSGTGCTRCGSAEEGAPEADPRPANSSGKTVKTLMKSGNINGNPRDQRAESRGNSAGALPVESFRIRVSTRVSKSRKSERSGASDLHPERAPSRVQGSRQAPPPRENPEVSEENPGEPGSLRGEPGRTRKNPGVSEENPEISGENPEEPGSLIPEVSEENPEISGENPEEPGSLRGEPGNLRGEPGRTRKSQRRTRKNPEVSEENPGEPGRTRKSQRRTRKNPEVSEENPGEPGRTRKSQGRTRKNPEVSEENPGEPGRTRKSQGRTRKSHPGSLRGEPGRTRKSQVRTRKNPGVSGENPEISSRKSQRRTRENPEVSGENPEEPGSLRGEPGNLIQEVSEENPGEPGSLIPEVSEENPGEPGRTRKSQGSLRRSMQVDVCTRRCWSDVTGRKTAAEAAKNPEMTQSKSTVGPNFSAAEPR